MNFLYWPVTQGYVFWCDIFPSCSLTTCSLGHVVYHGLLFLTAFDCLLYLLVSILLLVLLFLRVISPLKVPGFQLNSFYYFSSLNLF